MSNLFDLTKIYLKQIFSRYLYGEKAKRRGLLKTILLLIFIVAVIEYSISTMIYTTAEQLNKVNLSQFIIVYGLIVSALFSIFIMAYEMPAHFYNAKDYENLASLPINTWVVVSAKFLSGFLTALLYSLLFTLPTFVIYFVFNSITFGGVVYAILSLIFIPMFVMFVSCVIGFIINIITSKMKNKTVVNTIFMFLFLAGIFALSFSGGSGDGALMFSNGQVPLTIKILTPYIYFIFNAIYLNSFLYFVFFVLVNLAYLVLAIFVVTLTYKKINSNMLISKVKISKKPISFNTESVPKTLLKKESKSFFGSTVWSINALIGPIMVVVFSIIFGIVLINLKNDPNISSADFNVSLKMFMGMYIAFISMFSGLNVTTCVSISMEGQKIQILKQLPISFSQVAFSKILFSCLIELPFVYVANIIFLCFIPFNWAYALLIFVCPIVSVMAFSILGLLINLKYPKLNWNSEAEAVKQSVSVFVSLFSDMFIGAIPLAIFGSLFVTFFASLPVAYFVLMLLAWFVLWLVVAIVLMRCYGKKLYKKLS